MNDRLLIAAMILARDHRGDFNGLGPPEERAARYALAYADALIALEHVTVAKR